MRLTITPEPRRVRRCGVLLVLASLLPPVPLSAQDFANLHRYAKENRILRETARTVDTVIVGDSITERWVRNRQHFFDKTGLVGRGIVGETTPQMLLRFRQDVLELRPNTVVILAGTNDIAGNSGEIALDTTLGYLQSMVELAQQHNIVPVLCSVPPADRFFWNPGAKPAAKIVELNERIKTYAAANSLQYVDFHSTLRNLSNGMRTAFSDDGVHPNNLGYSAMELRLEQVLR